MEFSGTDRKAVRSIETIQSQLEQHALPHSLQRAYFHGMMGLLHLPFRPIWSPTVSVMADMLHNSLDQLWPVLLSRVMSIESSLMEPTHDTVQDTADDATPLCTLESIYGSEMLMRFEQEEQRDASDHLREFVMLAQIAESKHPGHLSRTATCLWCL